MAPSVAIRCAPHHRIRRAICCPQRSLQRNGAVRVRKGQRTQRRSHVTRGRQLEHARQKPGRPFRTTTHSMRSRRDAMRQQLPQRPAIRRLTGFHAEQQEATTAAPSSSERWTSGFLGGLALDPTQSFKFLSRISGYSLSQKRGMSRVAVP